MAKYTLTSYEPVNLELPKPPVPESMVDAQIKKMLEPLAEYHEIAESRNVRRGDFIVVTTEDACIDGNPAPNFVLKHSVYHLGAGEMPESFDEELVGMKVGETRDALAKIEMPLAPEDGHSSLTMKVTVEKILQCVQPKLTDELVKKNFEPATTVQEFREKVASQFGMKDMSKTDMRFPELIVSKLSERLVEEPRDEDRIPGQPLDALYATCTIDALAEHLNLELSDDEITAKMPGDADAQRKEMRAQLEEQGRADEALIFARREATLAWLVDNSRVSYK